MTEEIWRGGCLCGAVRFEARGRPSRVNHCHCQMCRRSSGAIAQTWATFGRDELTVARGDPAAYRASPRATRRFCATCGATLFWSGDGSERIDIAIGAFDAPTGLIAQRHDWAAMRLAAFSLDPHLPSFEN